MGEDFWKKYYPYTTSMGFIKADLYELYEAYSRWTKTIYENNVISIEIGSISDVIKILTPLQLPIKRVAFLQTNSDWISYFDDGINGPDPWPPLTYMAEVLECEAVITDFEENTLKSNIGREQGTYGSVQFCLYSPESKEFSHLKRAIGAVNDGGRWVFVDDGEPLPFEDTSRYSAKRTADRFDRKMLEDYCKALGIEIFNEKFYGNRFILSRPPEQ